MKWLRLCSLGYRREIYKSLIVAVIDNFLRSNDDEYCIGFWINSLKQLYPKTYEEYYDLQRYLETKERLTNGRKRKRH